MAIDARFKCVNPNGMRFQLTMEMDLEDWRTLKNHLQQNYPDWALGRTIGAMVESAETEHEREHKMDF